MSFKIKASLKTLSQLNLPYAGEQSAIFFIIGDYHVPIAIGTRDDVSNIRF
jgi:hypothetical protein